MTRRSRKEKQTHQFLVNDDSVAQLVEHNTFNVGVLGSSPSGITSRTRKTLQTSVFQRNTEVFLLKSKIMLSYATYAVLYLCFQVLICILNLTVIDCQKLNNYEINVLLESLVKFICIQNRRFL